MKNYGTKQQTNRGATFTNRQRLAAWLVCVATGATVLSSSAQSWITNGLVAHYPFNGNANDASGNGNNGTVNGATLTTDRFGSPDNAYSFNGSSFIGVPNSPSLASPGRSVTLSAWVRQTGWWITGVNRHSVILAKDTPQMTPVEQYGMGSFRGGGDVPPLGGLNSYIGYVGITNYDAIFMSNWVHVVMTFDVPVVKYYVNGVSCEPIIPYPGSQSPLPTNAEPVEIGRTRAGYPSYYYGQIDDIRIYNRALSSSEVAQLFAIESSACSPHAATATATLVSGFVVGATVTDPGCGYTNAPTVLVQGGGGSGATATAVVSNGVVVAVNITGAGYGYTSVPKVVIGSPPFVPTVSIAVSKVKVTQHVVLGRSYVLEASPDLVTWTATGPQFTADSETIVNEFDVDVTGRFFRLRQVP